MSSENFGASFASPLAAPLGVINIKVQGCVHQISEISKSHDLLTRVSLVFVEKFVRAASSFMTCLDHNPYLSNKEF